VPVAEGEEVFDADEVEDFGFAGLVEADGDIGGGIDEKVAVVWLPIGGHIRKFVIRPGWAIYLAQAPFLVRREPGEREPAGLRYLQLVDFGAGRSIGTGEEGLDLCFVYHGRVL